MGETFWQCIKIDFNIIITARARRTNLFHNSQLKQSFNCTDWRRNRYAKSANRSIVSFVCACINHFSDSNFINLCNSFHKILLISSLARARRRTIQPSRVFSTVEKRRKIKIKFNMNSRFALFLDSVKFRLFFSSCVAHREENFPQTVYDEFTADVLS